MSEMPNCCHTNEGEFEKICGKEGEKMRWSKKNKDLIKQVIDRYNLMLKKKLRASEFMNENCPFCPVYFCSDGCPNAIISVILNCYPEDSKLNCYKNAKYIGLKFWGLIPCKIPSNIKKRMRFFQDSLALTKREFLKKYKRRNAQHKTIPA